MGNSPKARPRPGTAAAAPGLDEDFEPIHIDGSVDEEDAPETVLLFTLDDVEYRIPKYPDARVALRYLRDVRKHGEDYAVAGMLTELLGEEGFDALCDHPGVKEAQFNLVMAAAQKHVMGSMEASRGNSGGGSRK